MTRIARYHPFAVLAGLTVAIPLLWRLSGLDYDQAPFGTALFLVSYVLMLPVQMVLGALYAASGWQPSTAVGLIGWSLVVTGYLALDYGLSRLVRTQAAS
jgi:hypothetical protein